MHAHTLQHYSLCYTVCYHLSFLHTVLSPYTLCNLYLKLRGLTLKVEMMTSKFRICVIAVDVYNPML